MWTEPTAHVLFRQVILLLITIYFTTSVFPVIDVDLEIIGASWAPDDAIGGSPVPQRPRRRRLKRPVHAIVQRIHACVPHGRNYLQIASPPPATTAALLSPAAEKFPARSGPIVSSS